MVLRISPSLHRIDLAGKCFVVTGGTCGSGEATVRFLAARGADVITSGRDLGRGNRVVQSLPKEQQAHVTLLVCDLCSMESIEVFASEVRRRWKKLDGLVNNAGGVFLPNDPNGILHVGGQTYDACFVANHVGHFHLTNLLLPLLKANGSARIVNVSSFMHDNYAGSGAKAKRSRIVFEDIHARARKAEFGELYGQSKLANVLHAKELARRYDADGIHAFSLHPGWIDSRFGRNFPAALKCLLHPTVALLRLMAFKWSPISASDGAQTTLHCLLSDEALKHNGSYFSQVAMIGYSAGPDRGWPLTSPNPEANDAAVAVRLWDVTVDMIAALKSA